MSRAHLSTASAGEIAVVDFSLVRMRWADDLPARPDDVAPRDRVTPRDDRVADRPLVRQHA